MKHRENAWAAPRGPKIQPMNMTKLEVNISPVIEKMAYNDKLLRVMQSLNESFPDEHFSDIERAAKSVLAALGGDE